jgi:hypothetical protein
MHLRSRNFLLILASAGAAAPPTWGQSGAPSVALFDGGAQSAIASCQTGTIDERYRCLSVALSKLLTPAPEVSDPADKSSACAAMDDADVILREMADLHKDVEAYKSEWERRSTTYTTIASKYFASFDAQKTVTLTGTVKELLLWVSPALIVLTLKSGEGEADQEWAIETNGLDGVVRERPATFAPGMVLTLTIHPLRNGTNSWPTLDRRPA